MNLQLDKLRMSPRHRVVENRERTTRNWPEIYFWTDGLMLLSETNCLLYHVRQAVLEARRKFFQGSLSPEIQKLNPELFANWPLSRIIEYCEIWRSRERAGIRLMIKARGERENREGKESEITIGQVRLDERQFVVRHAAAAKAVNVMGLPGLIHKAAKNNDVRLFIRLGKAPAIEPETHRG